MGVTAFLLMFASVANGSTPEEHKDYFQKHREESIGVLMAHCYILAIMAFAMAIAIPCFWYWICVFGSCFCDNSDEHDSIPFREPDEDGAEMYRFDFLHHAEKFKRLSVTESDLDVMADKFCELFSD